MDNQDISQIALERIKESGIKPISKNIFNLKRVIFWSFVGAALIVGIVSFSVTLSLLFNNDWDLYNKFGFNFIFKTLPYFWFICLMIFALLCEFYYRKTLLGYRHRVVTIVGIYIILTIIFGSVLHFFGMGEIIEKSFSENIPAYRNVIFDKNEFWAHPEEGLIYGKIISINNDFIKIVDYNNVIWTLSIDNTSIGKRVRIEEGEIIKIIGYIDNSGIFVAEQIRPWVGHKFNKNVPILDIVR
jgi:hypothetical protein